MKVLFVWTGVTSYMADCWRKLREMPDMELKVVIEQVASGREIEVESVLYDLDYVLVQDAGAWSPEEGYRPDVIFAVGWHSKVVRKAVKRREWKSVPKVCCFDLPWRWKLRCIAAKFVLAPFLRRYAAAYVPGLACQRYAKWLGFRRIYKGLFAIDTLKFKCRRGVECDYTIWEKKGFLYVGRISAEKRLDVIVRAYALYRESGGTWPLNIYGAGSEKEVEDIRMQIKRVDAYGAAVHPFVQPADVPQLYANHSCLVLASAFDPWPLVALEAKASGCEVILSERCGNRLELRTRVVKYDDYEYLALEMLKVEVAKYKRSNVWPQCLAEWDCETWAERTVDICRELT